MSSHRQERSDDLFTNSVACIIYKRTNKVIWESSTLQVSLGVMARMFSLRYSCIAYTSNNGRYDISDTVWYSLASLRCTYITSERSSVQTSADVRLIFSSFNIAIAEYIRPTLLCHVRLWCARRHWSLINLSMDTFSDLANVNTRHELSGILDSRIPNRS